MLLNSFQEQPSSDHPHASSVFSRISQGCMQAPRHRTIVALARCILDLARQSAAFVHIPFRDHELQFLTEELCLYSFPMLIYSILSRNCFCGQIKPLYDTEKLKNMQQKDKQDNSQARLSDNSNYLLLDDMRIYLPVILRGCSSRWICQG